MIFWPDVAVKPVLICNKFYQVWFAQLTFMINLKDIHICKILGVSEYSYLELYQNKYDSSSAKN